MRVGCTIVGLVLLGACASSAPSLTRGERERLPLDGRQEIFDSENDLIIARNRVDLARDRLREVEASLDGLDDQQSLAERRLAGNPATTGFIPSLRKVRRTEREYLEARRSVARAEVEFAVQEARTAQARVSYAIQRQLVRIGKAPSVSLEGYKTAIEEEEKKGRDLRSSSLDLRTKAQTLLDQWKFGQAEYAGQTGDFDSGIWLD